jgi:hypothetical protein
MDDQVVSRETTGARPSGGFRNAPREIVVMVAICLAILALAYVVLSGRIVNNVASAAGARPNNSFDALWFADPSVASLPIPRGAPVAVVVSNHTHSAQLLRWSTSSGRSTLQHGSIHLPKASTRTFVVQTRDARSGDWLWIRLDGTSIAIKAWIGE